MNLKPISKYFDKWLDDNIDRFKYKPIKLTTNTYKFDGIVDNIVLVFDDANCEVLIKFKIESDSNTMQDTISLGCIENLSFIDNKGYTDTSWIHKYKDKYYSTYEDMIIDNLFNPIINYCNDKFITKNSLYFVNINHNGITFALVTDRLQEKEIEKLRNACVQIDKKTNKDLAYTPTMFKCDIFIHSKSCEKK